MLYLKNFEDIILEKTIGSEAIRQEYYSDIPKSTFYKIINIDPTSVRKKEFSKPGKYSKWLLRQYKKGDLNDKKLENEDALNELNYYLFIFSTGWFKSFNHIFNHPKDILRYKSLDVFMSTIKYSYLKEYENCTEKSKFDVIYSNENIDVLVPLNFTASFNTAKNTEWCSQSYSGYSSWKQRSILFRIVPKDKRFDKLKLTWTRNGGNWYIACSKYPEISGEGSPFDNIDKPETNTSTNWINDDKVERWKVIIHQSDLIYKSSSIKWKQNSKNIKKTMSLLSKRAKYLIEEYYKKYAKV